MTDTQWHDSDDAGAMLDALWRRKSDDPGVILNPIWQLKFVAPCANDLQSGESVHESSPPQSSTADLTHALHRFYLASCRRIWKLLPQEESRRGVEMAEQFLAGTVSAVELKKYNWYVEGAAFNIDYNVEPEAIDRWVAEVRALPEDELRALLHPPEAAHEIDPRELLKQAAYFADYAMIYPRLSPKGPPRASYRPFLSAALLRQYVASVSGLTSGSLLGECMNP